MNAIRATVTDGKVTVPAEWADGTEVLVELVDEDVGCGMREEDWPTDDAGIAALLARIDALEPVMSPEDDAKWRAALAEQKAFELSKWEENSRKLEGLFE